LFGVKAWEKTLSRFKRKEILKRKQKITYLPARGRKLKIVIHWGGFKERILFKKELLGNEEDDEIGS